MPCHWTAILFRVLVEYRLNEIYLLFEDWEKKCHAIGQHDIVVKCLSGNQEVVGSNSTTIRNKNESPGSKMKAQKVLLCSSRISVEDQRYKAELDLGEKQQSNNKKTPKN